MLTVVGLAAEYKRSFERDNTVVSGGFPCPLSYSIFLFLCSLLKQTANFPLFNPQIQPIHGPDSLVAASSGQ